MIEPRDAAHLEGVPKDMANGSVAKNECSSKPLPSLPTTAASSLAKRDVVILGPAIRQACFQECVCLRCLGRISISEAASDYVGGPHRNDDYDDDYEDDGHDDFALPQGPARGFSEEGTQGASRGAG